MALRAAVLAAQAVGEVGEGLHGAGGVDARLRALVEDLDQGLIDDIGDFVDKQGEPRLRCTQVVAHAGERGEVGEQDGAEGATDRGIRQRIKGDVEHVSGRERTCPGS